MSRQPRLSIVVPSHRRTELLQSCLAALARWAPADCQVLVIDDGSVDAVVSRIAATFANVQIFRFKESRGFCAAANFGFSAATAPIVELLNDDAEVTPDWFEPALAAFDDQKVAAVAPLVLRWPGTENPPLIDTAGDLYDTGGFARSRGRGQRLCEEFLRPCPVDAASGSSAFFRRSAVLDVGGFAESFGAYFEDVDLCCRLRHAGHRIEYVPASRVLHRGGATYGRPRGRLLEQQSCNEERLFWRNHTGRPNEFLRHAAVVAGKALRRWREGQLTPWLCGRFRAFAMVPADFVNAPFRRIE